MTVASGAESFLNGGEAQEGSQTEEASTLGDSIEDNEMQVTKETSVGASTMADSSLGISDDESTFSSIKKGAQDGANGKSNPISPIQAEKILEPPKTVRTSGGLAEGLDRAGTTSAAPKIRNLTSNISGRVTRGGGIAPSGVNTETGGETDPWQFLFQPVQHHQSQHLISQFCLKWEIPGCIYIAMTYGLR